MTDAPADDRAAHAREDGAGGVVHGTLTTRRAVAAPPSSVFSAFADMAVRSTWFRIPSELAPGDHELDFRVGGGEMVSGTTGIAGITEHIVYRSHILDIEPAERIVLAYGVTVNDERRWTSQVTIELRPDGDGTSVTYTEQYAYLDATDLGTELAHLEGSTRLMLNNLAMVVERRSATLA